MFSDHHCPHVDPELHKSAVAWLRETKPDEIVVAGDLLDYDAVSRHRLTLGGLPLCRSALTPGTGCCATTWMLHRRPVHSDRRKPRGPLAERRARQPTRARSGVTRAKYNEPRRERPCGSVAAAPTRLDEIGIDFVGGQSEYQHYRHKLADTLAVRHGYLSKTGPEHRRSPRSVSYAIRALSSGIATGSRSCI